VIKKRGPRHCFISGIVIGFQITPVPELHALLLLVGRAGPYSCFACLP